MLETWKALHFPIENKLFFFFFSALCYIQRSKKEKNNLIGSGNALRKFIAVIYIADNFFSSYMPEKNKI